MPHFWKSVATKIRQLRRYDNERRLHVVALGLDRARRALLDIERAGLLEKLAAIAVDKARQREAVAPRVKLRLVLNARSRFHRPRHASPFAASELGPAVA